MNADDRTARFLRLAQPTPKRRRGIRGWLVALLAVAFIATGLSGDAQAVMRHDSSTPAVHGGNGFCCGLSR